MISTFLCVIQFAHGCFDGVTGDCIKPETNQDSLLEMEMLICMSTSAVKRPSKILSGQWWEFDGSATTKHLALNQKFAADWLNKNLPQMNEALFSSHHRCPPLIYYQVAWHATAVGMSDFKNIQCSSTGDRVPYGTVHRHVDIKAPS